MPSLSDADVHGFSRLVHRVDSATSRAGTVAIVVVAVSASLAVVAATGFSSSVQLVFTTVVAALTTVMVFVIQHTQNRQQLALQIKLDELLRALPQADNRFVHVEASADEELLELEHRHVETHTALHADPLDAEPL